MRVAIITPYYLQSTRGNAVTVRRIESHLEKLGCITSIFSLDRQSAESIEAAVRSFSPQLIHAFHAISCGSIASKLAEELNVPYVITMTGTDIFTDNEPESAAKRSAATKSAAALVFFAREIQSHYEAKHPDLAVSTALIPQGVLLPENIEEEPVSVDSFTFFLPAGIRPVKNVLFPFAPLADLRRRYPQLKLVIAGPSLDSDYTSQLLGAVAANPFSSWLGEVAYSDISSLYRSAHVVLNTSLSEGGMANTVLEGMAYGKPVLVSDIEGNRSLISDEVNGCLFSSEEEFIEKAERLLLDKEFRVKLAAAGRAYVMEHCQASEEAKNYRNLYLKILITHKGV